MRSTLQTRSGEQIGAAAAGQAAQVRRDSRGAQPKPLADERRVIGDLTSSPRIAAQRKQLQAAFGSALQRRASPQEEGLRQQKFPTVQPGAKAAQPAAKDHPGESIPMNRVDDNPQTIPVVQRRLSWHEGPRTKVKNLTGPILNFTDFGITPVTVNETEIPPGNAAAALLGPAILFHRRDQGGVEASIAAEPVNSVGYRMELPTDPPWVEHASVEHANAALGMISGFSISEAVAPDRDRVINVEARGLPSDAEFAALVERHEDVHVRELTELIHEILVPWDARIAKFRSERRVFVGEDASAAQASLYAALGGSAAQVGQRFNDGLRDRGLAFHQTAKGGSPTVDSTTFMGGTLRVYWKHPMGR